MTDTDRPIPTLTTRHRVAQIPGLLLAWIAFAATPFATGQSISLKFEPAEPIPKTLLLFNTDLLTAIAFNNISYDTPKFEDAIRELRPQGLRFPGGTIANHYRWEKDSFSEPTSDKTEWAAKQLTLFREIGRPYDLPGFTNLVRHNDLTPIWVLNVFEESPASVLKLFEKFKSTGLNVQAIEMANEPYWDGRTIDNVQQYIRLARPIANAIKQHYPNVKIGACFAPLNNDANYELLWNQPLARESWYDAIIFHDYYGGQGFAMEEGASVSVEAMLNPEAMIDQPIEAFAKLLPGTAIWLTEWNVGPVALERWKNKGAELQFIAAMLASLVEHRNRISIACFHAVCDSQFGPMFIDNQSKQLKTHASYELFQFLGTAFSDAEQLVPIEFPTNRLRGFGTQTGDDIRIFVLNRGDKDQQVRLPNACTGTLIRQTINCQPERDLRGLSHSELVRSSPIEGRITMLPANSISLIGRRATVNFDTGLDSKPNRLPSTPDLNLWYEPFANEQPKFDESGVYAVDLEAIKTKSVAVVNLKLDAIKLEPNREYVFEFEVKSDGPAELVLKLPPGSPPLPTRAETVPEKNERSFPLSESFTAKRFRFNADPAQTTSEISLIFPAATLQHGSKVSFKKFRILRTD